MPEWEARVHVEACAEMLAAGVPPPRPPGPEEGLGGEAGRAWRLARLLLLDLTVYGEGDLAEAAERGDVAARDRVVDEYRCAFRSRVDARLHHVFESELEHLDARLRGEQYECWLLDEASARSVGRRWAAALRRAPAGERPAALARAKRWLAVWSLDGAPRRAWERELRDVDSGPR
jgi:hypothetical protein